MFHYRPLRRLPPDIQLEIETLLSDLRGEKAPPLRDASGGCGEAVDVPRSDDRRSGAHLFHMPRLRRLVGGANHSR
jgi:hypothetical protein